MLVCRRRFHAPDAVPVALRALAEDLAALPSEAPEEVPFAAAAALTRWSAEADAALVRWFNERAEQQNCSVLDVDPAHFSQSSSDFQGKFAALARVPAAVLMFRASVIQALNALVRRCLPWLDLGCDAGDSVLARLVRRRAHLFFAEVKQSVLSGARDRTRGTGGANTTITLDNFLASESLEAGATGVATSNSCFAQAFRELHARDPTFLRSCWDGDRVFQVNFRGEHGSDAGGVFREGMSRCVEDLYSGAIDLLAPTPNNRSEAGVGADRWLPNVALAHSGLAREMLCFLGKLMAMSARALLCLPFNFPSIVWKRMLQQEITLDDVAEVDSQLAQLLRQLAACDGPDAFLQTFGGALTWAAPRLNGQGRILLNGRADEQEVAFEDAGAFARALWGASIAEVLPLIDEMARGFDLVLPLRGLALHTWQEVEVIVCGRASFDMAWWRAHTTYSGYDDTDEVIKNFWTVVNAWDDEQRSAFVRFAFGRSRLPPNESWYKDMQITRRNVVGDADASLPLSHTCFFSVELPPYTTLSSMRKNLQIAIRFGTAGVLLT